MPRNLSVLLALAFALAAVPVAFAEDDGARETAPPAAAPLAQPRITVVPSSKNDVSRPLRTVTPVFPSIARRETPENKPTPRLGAFAPKTLLSDPVVQASAAVGQMPATTQNFEGVASSDNVLDVIPPDTNGDVGPNHYVEWVNLAFSIYSKTGTRVYGPSAGSALWSGFGGVCESSNDGDPVVQYDPLAGRWLFSQFALPNYPSGPFYQCLAVSTSSDPTGSYYRYQFTFSNTVLNDYPKFGVWPDAYYMSVVEFGPSTYNGAGAVAFDRAKMLSGLPATAIRFDVGSQTNPMLPADVDGSTPPPAGSPNYFSELVDGVSSDQLKIWAFKPNWTTPASSTFTLRDTLTPASFDTNVDFIDEPAGYTQWLDAISDRPMYRLAYRNLGSREAMVFDHTVNVSGHAGVRWYELRKTTGPWSIFQQGTFSPSSDSRWMGSAAMDQNGDIAVGYSVSSQTVYPGIRYAGRLASDPAGLLSQGEATLKAGAGVETDFTGRWGDYSSMSVDPSDDCTFWYANEYFPVTSDRGWHTRIGSFKFPGCGVPVVPAPTITSFSPASGPVGSTVTINGTNFTGATSVTLRYFAATFTLVSPTQITANVPTTGYPDGRWRVTTPGGTAASATSFYTTAPPPAPSISSFTPTSGPVGTSVTINGSNFTGATSVKLGSVAASYAVNSSARITATVPSGASSAKWSVTTAGGTAMSVGTFVVTTITPAPTITGLSPMSGPIGSTVTITGTNFTGATSVTLRYVGTTFTVVSATRITATIPTTGYPDGRWRVTTAGGTAVSANFYTT